ncbi:hypothetical protein A3A67_01470 [Candidatus Peribacteria bacterium RIFCSPLOWO2_01_FULL_51_18]|nr:MAG: hypothetical protein A3C52_03060 [Candidatus Peribacteria bacterium RIFCSPHIGHO2_02_FULL_51_15]OGJ65373.1 MAG: hypothetical protein A3A67_01470 [Candidatus Peribacteria bacterium RIFCSPLOWO2_01_FULL_51_18]OGJ69598.1 MAG: hypothetical protein A3J34_00140 [Candidatus Peribacteria bacterium RIFCSPLOWO2_02_FULL_51_10]
MSLEIETLGTLDLTEHHKEKTIDKLIGFFGKDLRFLVERSWLDLGCGSNKSPDRFAPHACRILHDFGVKVTGIDLAPNDDETFENYQADLTNPHALDVLNGRKFDFIHHNALTFAGGGMESPTLGHMIDEIGEKRFEMQLLFWASKFLEPNGIYFQEWHVWQKKDEGLKRLSAVGKIRIARKIRDTMSRLRK